VTSMRGGRIRTFQWPGPANGAHLSLRSMRSRIVPQSGEMSFPVRQKWAKVECAGVGTREKGSVEMSIFVPVALTASFQAQYLEFPYEYSPQLCAGRVE
jgi:hypothetical protein